MSRFNSDNFNIEDDKQQSGINRQGKSFLELLLQDSDSQFEGEDFPEGLFDEVLGEIPIPNRKKRFKFLRFPKLKAMLDMLEHTEPEMTDGYVIMDNEQALPKVEEIIEAAEKKDDTEEFLNKIEENLKHFGRIGKRIKKDVENGKMPLESDDDEAFESAVIKSITQDEAVVSETLAELLVMQGQKSKAIKMYKALILKFPEKSRYFAKQIKLLK
jgi:hypothetical protein